VVKYTPGCEVTFECADRVSPAEARAFPGATHVSQVQPPFLVHLYGEFYEGQSASVGRPA
jgi:hypothetical protein